ncbi:MAG: FGGY family carbohydrate kinase [Caldilineaceae bacterium]
MTTGLETLRRTHAVLRAKDWIFLNLTGQVSTDESDASHTYFAAATRHVDPQVLALLGIGDLQPLLPPIRPSRSPTVPPLCRDARPNWVWRRARR